MHPAEIQAELKKREITQKEIAQDLGVSQFHVSEVINKHRVSNRVMRHVAKIINRDHREIFPEYYFSKKRRSKAA